MAISMTEAAAKHVQRSLEGRGKGEGIRLGVRTTGCSGLAYVLEFVDELAAEDLVFESHGVKVIIDPKSLVYLDGTELDFTREGSTKASSSTIPTFVANAAAAKASTSEAGVGKPCHFAQFDLQPAFLVDLDELGQRYRELVRSVHPDRFADAPEREQRLALERAAQLNEAYQTLKSAPRRALYLLTLSGHELPLEATVQDPEFLLQQMQLREELEELQDSADLAGVATFKRRLKAAQAELEREFAACWDDAQRREEAERLVRRMQFLDKLAQEVRQLEERLDD